MRKEYKHSEKTKKKISEALKGKKSHRLRAIFSIEHKLNLSNAAKGRILSEETKHKISESMKGKIPWIKGRKHTEESKRKMSDAVKGQIPWNKNKTLSKETKEKLSKINRGKKHSEKTKIQMSISHMKCRTDGYCDAWSDREYKADIRKTACQNCGVTDYLSLHIFGYNLDLHHINGDKGDCRPDNLATLCRSCHGKEIVILNILYKEKICQSQL